MLDVFVADTVLSRAVRDLHSDKVALSRRPVKATLSTAAHKQGALLRHTTTATSSPPSGSAGGTGSVDTSRRCDDHHLRPFYSRRTALRAIRIIANLRVPDVGTAKRFYTDYLGLSTEEFNMGWVARYVGAGEKLTLLRRLRFDPPGCGRRRPG